MFQQAARADPRAKGRDRPTDEPPWSPFSTRFDLSPSSLWTKAMESTSPPPSLCHQTLSSVIKPSCERRRCSSRLVWIVQRIFLSPPNLSLLFGHNVLRKQLDAVLFLELADEPRIPKLRRNAKVLATAHERVALTAFRCRRNPTLVKVVLLSSGHRNQAAVTYKSVLPRHGRRCDESRSARRQSPSSRPKRPVQDPAVLDLGKKQDPI